MPSPMLSRKNKDMINSPKESKDDTYVAKKIVKGQFLKVPIQKGHFRRGSDIPSHGDILRNGSDILPLRRLLVTKLATGLRMHKSSEELYKDPDEDFQHGVHVNLQRSDSLTKIPFSSSPNIGRTLPNGLEGGNRSSSGHKPQSMKKNVPVALVDGKPQASIPPSKTGSLSNKKPRSSPTSGRKSEGSVAKIRQVRTEDVALNSLGPAELSGLGNGTQDDDPELYYVTANMTMSTNNGGGGGGSGGAGSGTSDITNDDLELSTDVVDSNDVLVSAIDQARTSAAIDTLKHKIRKTMVSIKDEQNAKEENVNEYLRLAANADKQQTLVIKSMFEKKNQKSTQVIATLQRKLDGYHKRLREVEMHGVTGHRQAKEVLKDVGQGLKGVVDNIRGAKESIVSKPKEFAHLIKNKFGSADNINNIKNLDDPGSDREDNDKHSTYSGKGATEGSVQHESFRAGNSMFYAPSTGLKYDDDDQSSISDSAPSGGRSSPRPHSDSAALYKKHADTSTPVATAPHRTRSPEVANIDLTIYLRQMEEIAEHSNRVEEMFENFRVKAIKEIQALNIALDEERQRAERLEQELNDLTELHQNENINIKQELTGMEEKMEYQLEERTRDMQDMLEDCQTKLKKMEQQQQHQQLISMESLENSNFRQLITKLINVILALLAVILVLVSTVANFLGPFLTTRFRILTTVTLVILLMMIWQHWTRFLLMVDSVHETVVVTFGLK